MGYIAVVLTNKDGTQVTGRRQVLDALAVSYDVIEHQSLSQHYHCRQRRISAFPDRGTAAVQYGTNMRALGVHLTQRQLLPLTRATQFIFDVYGPKISVGTLALHQIRLGLISYHAFFTVLSASANRAQSNRINASLLSALSKARSAEVGLFRIARIMLYFRLDCHGYLWHDGG